MVEQGRGEANLQLLARVTAFEGRIGEHFSKTDKDPSAAPSKKSVIWAGSPSLRGAVTRGVSLALASESPSDFITVIRGEIDKKRITTNGQHISNAEIPQNRELVQKYLLSKEEHFSTTDALARSVSDMKEEEVAVGKSVVEQLERILETQQFDRERVATLLAQLTLLSEGQSIGARQNLKARMILFASFASEAVAELGPQETLEESHVVYQRADQEETPTGVAAVLKDIDDSLALNDGERAPSAPSQRKNTDVVLDDIDDVLRGFPQ